MAGDWIKIECTTPNKTEVWKIAQRLDLDPDAVLGKLARVWIWADSHTEDGHAPSVTKMIVDREVGVTGFCDALIEVGWLLDHGETIEFPRFDRHNGKSAKKRVLAAERQRKRRDQSVTNESDASRNERDIGVTREEKRRDTPSLRSGVSAPDARDPKPVTTVARFARPSTEPDPQETKPPKRRTNVSVEHMVLTLPGLSEAVAADYLVHRKSKRASLTETAWSGICKNIEKAGAPPDEALTLAMVRGWQGFEPDWWANAQRQAGGGHEAHQRGFNEPRISAAERSVNAIAELRRREGRG